MPKNYVFPLEGPTIRVLMMPRETNGAGTIFGGAILSYVDQAGGIMAQHYAHNRVVTVAMKEVVFLKPVFVGDLVSFYAQLEKVGKTSITTRVRVQAARGTPQGPEMVDVTEAVVTYVAVDAEGNPVSPLPKHAAPGITPEPEGGELLRRLLALTPESAERDELAAGLGKLLGGTV